MLSQEILNRLAINDPALTELNCSNFNLNEAQYNQLIAALEANTTITKITLRNSNLGALAVDRILTALKNNKQLSAIDLSQNPIGPIGLAFVAAFLKPHQTLKELKLEKMYSDFRPDCGTFQEMQRELHGAYYVLRTSADNGRFGTGLYAFAEALLENKSLSSLSLADNPLVREEPKAIKALAAALKAQTGLETLSFNGCQLGEDNVAAIAEMLQSNTRLRSIDFRKLNLYERSGSGFNGLIASWDYLVAALKMNTGLKTARFSLSGEPLYNVPDHLCFQMLHAILKTNINLVLIWDPMEVGDQIGRYVYNYTNINERSILSAHIDRNKSIERAIAVIEAVHTDDLSAIDTIKDLLNKLVLCTAEVQANPQCQLFKQNAAYAERLSAVNAQHQQKDSWSKDKLLQQLASLQPEKILPNSPAGRQLQQLTHLLCLEIALSQGAFLSAFEHYRELESSSAALRCKLVDAILAAETQEANSASIFKDFEAKIQWILALLLEDIRSEQVDAALDQIKTITQFSEQNSLSAEIKILMQKLPELVIAQRTACTESGSAFESEAFLNALLASAAEALPTDAQKQALATAFEQIGLISCSKIPALSRANAAVLSELTKQYSNNPSGLRIFYPEPLEKAIVDYRKPIAATSLLCRATALVIAYSKNTAWLQSQLFASTKTLADSPLGQALAKLQQAAKLDNYARLILVTDSPLALAELLLFLDQNGLYPQEASTAESLNLMLSFEPEPEALLTVLKSILSASDDLAALKAIFNSAERCGSRDNLQQSLGSLAGRGRLVERQPTVSSSPAIKFFGDAAMRFFASKLPRWAQSALAPKESTVKSLKGPGQ